MTITIPAGQREAMIPVTTIENTIYEGQESFTVVLSNPSEGLTVGGQDTATVTVEDEGKYVSIVTMKAPHFS